MLNTFCYIIGWFWCMLWGIAGHWIIAVQGAIFLIILQLYYARQENESLFIQDLKLVSVSIPLGFLIELFLIQTHVIQYGGFSFPPLWIIAIYPLFALLVNHIFSFLKQTHLIASFVIGLLGIPSSYFWLNTHGALNFGYSAVLTWLIIGTCWGLFLSLLVKVTKK